MSTNPTKLAPRPSPPPPDPQPSLLPTDRFTRQNFTYFKLARARAGRLSSQPDVPCRLSFPSEADRVTSPAPLAQGSLRDRH